MKLCLVEILPVILGVILVGSSAYAALPKESKKEMKGTIHTTEDIYLNSTSYPSRKKNQAEVTLASGPAVNKNRTGPGTKGTG